MIKRIRFNFHNIILIALFVASLFMCVGYATVNNITLDLAGEANILRTPMIFILTADIDPNSDANVSDSAISLTYETLMESTVVLNNDVDSELTMNITIKNTTDTTTFFDQVVYDSGFYDNNNIDFTLSGLVHNQSLNPGASVNFTITFKYTDAYKATNPSTFTNTLNSYLNFQFGTGTYAARIGNAFYGTLQQAFNAVPSDGTATTVVVLRDITEAANIAAGQNVVLSVGNNTLHNNGGNPIIETLGTLTINDGTFTSGGKAGVINVQSGGTAIITGGIITNTYNRQAVYNNGGTLRITGGTLSNNTGERAAVHNLNNGTTYITGGTITAGNNSAVYNESGTVTIGTKDGSYNSASPILQGMDYGVRSVGDVNYYDGVIKGHTAAFNDETKVVDQETNMDIVHSVQSINGVTYDVAKLGQSAIVTFDANGGTSSEVSRSVEVGVAIGALPTATRTNHDFLGWWTDPNNGTQVTSSYVVTGPTILYAHWLDLTTIKFAKIGNTEYLSFDDAWAAATASNSAVTIELLRNCTASAKSTVGSGKNITLDLAGYTLDYTGGIVFEVNNGGTLTVKDTQGGGILEGGRFYNNTYEQVIKVKSGGHVVINSGTVRSSTSQVMDSSGTVDITGGTITFSGNVNQGLINNNAGGIMNISGGTINNPYSIEKGQAVYNKGTLNISGNPVLTTNSYGRATVQNDASGAVINISGGTISSTNSNCSRGTIQNINNATVNITGGTIRSASTNTASGAVQNAGTLTIGDKDGTIDASSPVLEAMHYGVNSTKAYNFYDGIIKGVTDAYNRAPGDIETNSQIITGTETIGGQSYHTAHLQ